ncbi:sensor histidine kinase, partial [Sulfurospirillum cavolei]|uniref:sensor histidine kinase n=1 Tax=Sulfurospirillum cavolei TaxID=366522 RepID=UPI003FA2A1B6
EKQPLFSNIKNQIVDVNATRYAVRELATPINEVAYIVVDEAKSEQEIFTLKFIIFLSIFISAIFVGIEGYFLSRFLLKPVHSRIEKLNKFIKDSSHELNTPVAALMMSVSSLKQSSFSDRRIINHISISTKLISQIYNSLSYIAFNDIDEVFEETFDLALFIQESVSYYNEIAATKENTITAQLQTTFIHMDKSRIQKVIHNLLSNAIKYSYPKTTISVKLSEYLLTVTDKGIGISEENKKTIFKRFERRSTTVGGFGIGLDIVNSVCKMYRIKVWVESVAMKETTFYLQFPPLRNVTTLSV